MTHNLLYRIPDNIYQTFFCAKVLLNRLPDNIYEEHTVSSSDESDDIDKSYEYYLDRTKSEQVSKVDGIMLTRSAWKKINRNLPVDCQIPAVEPIPKIVIKKKSKSVRNKDEVQALVVEEKENKPRPSTPESVKENSYKTNSKKRRRNPARSARIRKRKARTPDIVPQPECIKESTPCESVANYKRTVAEQSARTAETGYSSAADSTTNEPTAISVEKISKPILNYTLIPKARKGKHSKTCCLDFVILPPTEPISPSKVEPNLITKLRRGRPRKIIGKDKPVPKTQTTGVEKKVRKKYVRKSKLVVSTPLPIPYKPLEVAVGPGKSLPILEGPPNMTRAAWIKEQLMAEDFMCRIPLSKISRIPRVIKLQMPPIKANPKSDKPKQNIDSTVKPILPQIEPEKIEQPTSILEVATSDVTKGGSTIEAINDWFTHDLDLSSLNETNYNETNMVLEDQYFPKNTSFTSTPCPNLSTQPIETYMTEKLATETLPDISFGSTLFNYTETADSLVTPLKQLAPQTVTTENENIPATVIDFDTKPEALDFSFKQPTTKHIFQTTSDSDQKQYINSPDSEPLDLCIRKTTPVVVCSQLKYAPSLSPQPPDDVLQLDASYMDIDSTPRHNSSTDNFSSPLDHQHVKNVKIDNLLSDMDDIVREQDRTSRNNSQQIRDIASSMSGFQSQDDLRKSKIVSELNKITRTIRLNECAALSQPESGHDLRPSVGMDRPPCSLQYNSNLSYDHISLKRRVLQIFGFPCFRFLNGKCVTFPCKYSHNFIEPHLLQAILTSEPTCVIDKCYDLIIQHEVLFIKYFESFCIIFGKSQMILSLIVMIKHCERMDRPIGFYRHIITGLGFCKLDKYTCYMTLVKNCGPLTNRSIDVLIDIMLEMEVVLQFTDKLEEFLKVASYRINTNLFDRMLDIGKRTKDPELIRILLETINNYPNDCQKRLNSTVLTQFLQMVRNLKSLQT